MQRVQRGRRGGFQRAWEGWMVQLPGLMKKKKKKKTKKKKVLHFPGLAVRWRTVD